MFKITPYTTSELKEGDRHIGNLYLLDEKITHYLLRYFHLQIGNQEVKTPYFINTKKRKDLRSLVGKGTPEEIEMETKVWAQVKNLDLNTASAQQIKDLMLKIGIGVDCSGFVYHALNYYLKQNGGRELAHMLKHEQNGIRSKLARIFRPAENVGANILTSPLNTLKIAVNEVRPGDFIRGIGKQRNAYHLAIVVRVETSLTETGENVRKVFYMHSHRAYGDENGVRQGEMLVTDPTASYLDQNWTEVHSDGKNYLYDEFSTDPDNSGFCRLYIFSTN